MKQIADHPNGWIPYFKAVREAVGRELNSAELASAMQAYIKPITAEAFVAKLKDKQQ